MLSKTDIFFQQYELKSDVKYSVSHKCSHLLHWSHFQTCPHCAFGDRELPISHSSFSEDGMVILSNTLPLRLIKPAV